jgi:hypothetical protein
MNERITEDEGKALRAAQLELDRASRRRTEIKVWFLVTTATFALVIAGFAGWYLGSR